MTQDHKSQVKRATTLEEACNNLVVEPLRTDDDFREFYVNRSSPIKELKIRLDLFTKPQKCLFMGFRGCGKSTELNRLKRMLDMRRYLIVEYSIKDDLDINDFDFREFFAGLALNLYGKAVEENLPLKKEIQEDFEDFMLDIVKISEEEVEKKKGFGMMFSKFLLLKMSTESTTRDYIRKELETKITDLIQRLNWLIREVESLSKKRVVVLIDDLDKLTRYEQAENFFYKNFHLLLQPNCHIIYTFPVPLAFDPRYEGVRQSFDADLILPQPPVMDRDWKKRDEDGFDFYRKVILNRMSEKLIDTVALDAAIESTGKLSEFISIVSNSAIKAYERNNNGRIEIEDVELSLETMRRTYDRTLTQEHIRKLLEIHRSKESRDKLMTESTARELLFSLTAVEYETEEGKWCEVNPLLLPLIPKWEEMYPKN